MTNRAELLRRISQYPDNDDEYAVAIWCKEDIIGKAKEMGVKLSGADANTLLNVIDRKQDCEYGISWLTLECYIDMRGELLES